MNQNTVLIINLLYTLPFEGENFKNLLFRINCTTFNNLAQKRQKEFGNHVKKVFTLYYIISFKEWSIKLTVSLTINK